MTTVAAPPAARVELPAARTNGRRYWQLIVVLGALTAIGPLTVDTYLPALPTLSAQLGATDAQAQLTITGLLVGLGLGQLVVGPLSDMFGRRRPLLIGLVAHALMSVMCAMAPSIEMLALTRTLQGVAGSAVAVVSMAMVRDLFAGVQAAKALSRLVLIIGVAPILAPSLGSALLELTSWRGIFVVLALTALALLTLALVALPETLPAHRRRPASIVGSLNTYAGLFRDRVFVVLVGVAGLMFATLFMYIAGSSFILQEQFGLNAQQFGIAFSANAVGMILATQVNPFLLRRYQPSTILTAAVGAAAAGSTLLVITSLTGWGGLAGFMAPVALIMSAIGFSFPNAPAVALSRHGDAAGAASALLGGSQFLIGGAVAPLVGALDDGTARPMAILMALATAMAFTLLIRQRRPLLESTLSMDSRAAAVVAH
jgi:MFS transporter, DHA1 family, multidrug resistance protein